MAKFIVRVQLTGAREARYDDLHEAMETAGFSREITGRDGKTYHLARAEYRYESTAPLKATDIRDRVRDLVHGLNLKSRILVSRYLDAAWCGLELVPEADDDDEAEIAALLAELMEE